MHFNAYESNDSRLTTSLFRTYQDKKKKDKKARKGSGSSSSSSSSSDDSSDEEATGGDDVITRTLLKEYLEREINMLTLELTQPEVSYWLFFR